MSSTPTTARGRQRSARAITPHTLLSTHRRSSHTLRIVELTTGATITCLLAGRPAGLAGDADTGEGWAGIDLLSPKVSLRSSMREAALLLRAEEERNVGKKRTTTFVARVTDGGTSVYVVAACFVTRERCRERAARAALLPSDSSEKVPRTVA